MAWASTARRAGSSSSPLNASTSAGTASMPTSCNSAASTASDAFARQDYPVAIAHWEALQAAAPPGSQLAASVPGYIDEARRLEQQLAKKK